MTKPDCIRVFVVDDHPMIRSLMSTIIDDTDDMQWVGEAADGLEALSRIPLAAPDVVLMDLVMPRMDGISAIAALSPRLPYSRFVIVTSVVDPVEMDRASRAGAVGYVLKNASMRGLLPVIRDAQAGRQIQAPEIDEALILRRRERPTGADLTQRERELLAVMTRGRSNHEIASELGIAVPTVKFHITNILSKLHSSNRIEAVLKALKHKLVPAP